MPDQPDNLFDYFRTHVRETIAYILLIVGLLLLFFEPVYGGLLVGIVAGIYFGNEILNYIKNWRSTVNSQSHYAEIARNLVLAGLALAFLISAPAIFLGAAISIGIKELFLGQETK